MKKIIDEKLVTGFVYEVYVVVEAHISEKVNNKIVKYDGKFNYTTTFNPVEPDTCIGRCINKSKFDKEKVFSVEIKFKQQLSESNI